MWRVIGTWTDDTDSSTETEDLIANTPSGISDHELGFSSSVSVTSEDIAQQIKAVSDLLTQQLAHLCELMLELRNEQMSR